MAKKNTEDRKYMKNVLVKGKVKYVEMTNKEIEELQKLAADEKEGE